MSHRLLVFYGSYRSNRMGIRLAEFLVERFRRRGEAVELIENGLPAPSTQRRERPLGFLRDRVLKLRQSSAG